MKACYTSDERLKVYTEELEINLANIRGFGKSLNIATVMLPEPLVDEAVTKITYGPIKSKNARKKW